MAGTEEIRRVEALRARLEGFREGEALAGAGIDALRLGLEKACARVNAAQPEARGADRLNPQHWGYALYVYFRDRIIVRCTILPVTEAKPEPILLRVDVATDNLRSLARLSLERTGPASTEWRTDGLSIEAETFFLELLERYAGSWAG